MTICDVQTIEPARAHSVGNSNSVRVTVVVPCFNESEGIHDTLAQLLRAQQACAPQYALQFLFIDDASTDDTVAKIEAAIQDRPDFELVKHAANRGITGAILTGITQANTELVASLDADCTYDPARLIDLLNLLASCEHESVAMVTASPYHPRGAVENVPAWRLWISGGCSQLYRWVMRTSLHTYTSCFRVYRRESFIGWQPQNTGFVGLVEMIRMLEERGERIIECPAVLKVRQFGQSKMRIVSVASQHLQFIASTVIRRITRKRNVKTTSQPTTSSTIT